jgi:hypothetical protein
LIMSFVFTLPESHIFFVLYGGEVGKPFSIFGHVSRAAGVHQSYVL